MKELKAKPRLGRIFSRRKLSTNKEAKSEKQQLEAMPSMLPDRNPTLTIVDHNPPPSVEASPPRARWLFHWRRKTRDSPPHEKSAGCSATSATPSSDDSSSSCGSEKKRTRNKFSREIQTAVVTRVDGSSSRQLEEDRLAKERAASQIERDVIAKACARSVRETSMNSRSASAEGNSKIQNQTSLNKHQQQKRNNGSGGSNSAAERLSARQQGSASNESASKDQREKGHKEALVNELRIKFKRAPPNRQPSVLGLPDWEMPGEQDVGTCSIKAENLTPQQEVTGKSSLKRGGIETARTLSLRTPSPSDNNKLLERWSRSMTDRLDSDDRTCATDAPPGAGLLRQQYGSSARNYQSAREMHHPTSCARENDGGDGGTGSNGAEKAHHPPQRQQPFVAKSSRSTLCSRSHALSDEDSDSDSDDSVSESEILDTHARRQQRDLTVQRPTRDLTVQRPTRDLTVQRPRDLTVQRPMPAPMSSSSSRGAVGAQAAESASAIPITAEMEQCHFSSTSLTLGDIANAGGTVEHSHTSTNNGSSLVELDEGSSVDEDENSANDDDSRVAEMEQEMELVRLAAQESLHSSSSFQHQMHNSNASSIMSMEAPAPPPEGGGVPPAAYTHAMLGSQDVSAMDDDDEENDLNLSAIRMAEIEQEKELIELALERSMKDSVVVPVESEDAPVAKIHLEDPYGGGAYADAHESYGWANNETVCDNESVSSAPVVERTRSYSARATEAQRDFGHRVGPQDYGRELEHLALSPRRASKRKVVLPSQDFHNLLQAPRDDDERREAMDYEDQTGTGRLPVPGREIDVYRDQLPPAYRANERDVYVDRNRYPPSDMAGGRNTPSWEEAPRRDLNADVDRWQHQQRRDPRHYGWREGGSTPGGPRYDYGSSQNNNESSVRSMPSRNHESSSLRSVPYGSSQNHESSIRSMPAYVHPDTSWDEEPRARSPYDALPAAAAGEARRNSSAFDQLAYRSLASPRIVRPSLGRNDQFEEEHLRFRHGHAAGGQQQRSRSTPRPRAMDYHPHRQADSMAGPPPPRRNFIDGGSLADPRDSSSLPYFDRSVVSDRFGRSPGHGNSSGSAGGRNLGLAGIPDLDSLLQHRGGAQQDQFEIDKREQHMLELAKKLSLREQSW